MNADTTALFNYFCLARHHVALTELAPDAGLTRRQREAAELLHIWQSAALQSLDLMRRGYRSY